MQEGNRIGVLDSFRSIAVLFVIVYHYYARWAIAGLSITNDQTSGFHQLLSLGHIGVHFFFIISGFIILYTIDKSDSYKEFLVRRFIRLFPPILICSLITFMLVPILDSGMQFPEFHGSVTRFLPSLTFSNSHTWSLLVKTGDWRPVDGAYWSLSVEVTFYIIVGFLYFINKEKFISRWMLLVTVLTVLSSSHLIIRNAQRLSGLHNNILLQDISKLMDGYDSVFSLSGYIIYFTIGIVGYMFFSKKHISVGMIITSAIFIAYQSFTYYTQDGKILFLVQSLIIILFVMFVFVPTLLCFLDKKFMQHIGELSYTMYLIHQFIGVILISKLIQWINIPGVNGFIPVIVTLLVIGFAELSWHFYEKPVNSYLKSLIKKRKQEGR